MLNLVEVNKNLSEENFRKLGLEGVIQVLLPVIREMVIQGDSDTTELRNQLNAELIKNEELHKVIVNITKNGLIHIPLDGGVEA